ncbi:hypothetical protein G1K75_12575 [Tenacibaculum finnmarkense]|uniref:hypothetical protein n=1 Tax=Tenacibaculum finnmarkense TaxID=2781243 RepID=UPI001EFBACB4|nr:hypothetical protein [Tenacibaculum finnmarkense]MCG8806486.1 hypothetical protein [Tenacibaculum finnmarkense]MCG8857614.1 hypothetical protein [Tenacibaculum finnmarkense]
MENEITKTTLINFEIDWSKPTFLLESNWYILGPIIIISIGAYLIWLYKIKSNFSVHEMSVNISAKPKMTFKVKRNSENLFIANRIYLELITRKAALPFDEDDDVITEVYDSWYTLFKTIREEIKNVPGEYLKSHNPTEELIGLTVNILNDGLRNHLTKYQARFRKWYKIESEKTENKTLSPQDLQRKYSDYDNLVMDLKSVNTILLNYSNELKKLIKG